MELRPTPNGGAQGPPPAPPRDPGADRLRCLDCGLVYVAGIELAGCPSCGYIGWLAASIPVKPEFGQRRSGEDRPQPPPGPPR
jgi:hypothetical protein